MSSPCRETGGFTLVELAMVLVIIALLAGGLLVPIGTQFDARKRDDNQRRLDEAKEALVGFALSHGHLPCPATPGSTSGLEARSSPSVCSNPVGLLPWATLGLTPYDAYGNHLRYAVAGAFADSMSPFGFGSASAIRIKTRDASGTQRYAGDANATVAVVLSHGGNGAWAYRDGRLVEDVSSTNLDEDENGNGSGTAFFERQPTPDTGSPGGEFDDQLVWISTPSLLARMVAARRLP